MSLSINQNIMAMNSYRNLSSTQNGLSKSLEKLSSGFRINRAADDAAGLAISEGLRSQVGGNKQAVRNAQDGISVVQTAEGALQEAHSILQRMRDLAVQGANDSNDAKARNNIDTELGQLRDELERIGNVTNFNGTKLLDGSASGSSALKFQVGANGTGNDAITVDLKDADVTTLSNFAKKITEAPVKQIEGAKALEANKNYDLVLNGKPLEIKLAAADSDVDKMKAAIQKALDSSDVDAYVVGGKADIESAELTENTIGNTAEGKKWSLKIDGQKVEYTTVAGHATKEDVAQALQAKIDENAALKGNYKISIKDGKSFKVEAVGTAANKRVDVELKTEDTTNVPAGKAADNTTAGLVIKGKVGTASGAGYAIDVTAAKKVKITMADGSDFNRSLHHSLSEHGATAGSQDKNFGFKLQDAEGADVTDPEAGKEPEVNTLTVKDHKSAQELISVLDNKIQSVSTARANLGAIQNRFEHTITNLNVAVENLSASESRIRDTDMAQEMMQFTRNQILSQAGTAMLAQANQVPQGVLSLLR